MTNKFLDRILAGRLARRRAAALKKIKKLQRFAEPLGELRQFVYLDDTALRSLYVARYGAEAVKITESETRSREAEVMVGGSYSIPASVGFQAEGRVRGSATAGREVERLVSKQSMFRDFLNAEVRAARDTSASVTGGASLWRGSEASAPSGGLERGQLVEVRIRLQAHKLYRFASFLDSVGRLSEDGPASEMEVTARLLQELLIGQVPIEAEVLDWGWNETDGTLSKLTPGVTPLSLVALTDVANYWTDLRRMLFDGLECTALVRLSDNTVVRNWSPLKLFNAIRGIEGLPGVDMIDNVIHGLDGYLTAPAAQPDDDASAVREAFTVYAQQICSGPLPETDVDSIGRLTVVAMRSRTTSVMNETFSYVESLFSRTYLENWTADQLGEFRETACAAAGIGSDGSRISPAATQAPVSRPIVPTGPQLAGEIIAIYW
ncbi:hypothetical protein SAMN06295974_1926 [Plantibacter flavus]|uniref:Uncharacterized protein n=1 Tax=Plantibacter flavus TaxID=150123 RepID=A0A3N2BXM3_9MICO|nr:hypothetical protein [Plantibacter flavus]ROR80031.1 hypothetical protein EDD42_0063 [Plantibacter flavus]SMG28818.1 hypothetical protein SAMN06295974_1926 [Plantibacter flavus]